MPAPQAPNPFRPRLPRPGFTLIELLVVIGILGLLISLTIPAVTRSLARSREAQCASQLRQIVMGVLSYARDHGGRTPPLGAAATFAEHLEDYLPLPGGARAVSVWKCPSDSRTGAHSSYGVNRGGLTPEEAREGWLLTRVDSPSLTILMADSGGQAGTVWDVVYHPHSALRESGVEFRHGRPRGNQASPAGSPAAFRQSRANFAFYDGRVEPAGPGFFTQTNWFQPFSAP